MTPLPPLPPCLIGLKESRVVVTESLSIELKESIIGKCSKRRVFEILEELMLY